MSFFAELFALVGSIVGLASVLIETCGSGVRRDEYVPKHMKDRRGGTAPRHKKDRQVKGCNPLAVSIT